LQIFKKISDKYKSFNIKYEYNERGSDFAGYANISKGVCTDNCFTYWEGLVAIDEDSALEQAIENELECMAEDMTLKKFKKSTLYKAFNSENKKELEKEFLSLKKNGIAA